MLYGGKYTCGDHPFTHTASHKDTAVGTKNLQFGLQTKRIHFHQSNVYCSCFLAKASLFFWLVSFSSVFFAAIQPRRPDSHSLLWTVDIDMLLELCEAFIWAAISEAGTSNELILCSRGNSDSTIPVEVLVSASFIIVLDCFYDCTWRNFQSSLYFPYWLTFIS